METKCWRKIILPVIWEKTAWGSTRLTGLKYDNYFNDNKIEWKKLAETGDRSITYELNCTEEDLLVVKLSL